MARAHASSLTDETSASTRLFVVSNHECRPIRRRSITADRRATSGRMCSSLLTYAHQPMTRSEDPGWPNARTVLFMLVPGARLWHIRRQRSGDPLVLLRAVFLSFSIAVVGF